MQAFSIDLVGELALFKKNDANDIVHISYNFIHKPAILGIFGAILGLSGYAESGQGNNPEYYKKLESLQIAIKPHYAKPLKKVITGFNNASGMGANMPEGGAWQVREQILVGNPEIRFTIFVLFNSDNEMLRKKMENYETTYPLYFGKNEFFAHYENYKEYHVRDLSPNSEEPIQMDSLIKKDKNGNNYEQWKLSFDNFDPLSTNENSGYIIFEQLPYDFDEYGFYKKDLFIWMQKKIKILKSENFKQLISEKGDIINVQFI